MSSLGRPHWVLLIVLLLLLSGCQAINELRNDGITGPSWDVDIAIPLVPTYPIKIGEIFAEQFEETPEGGFRVEGTIEGLDPIYPMDEMDLSDFTTEIGQTVNIDEDEDGNKRFDFDNLLDVEGETYSLEEFKGQLNYDSFQFFEVYDDFGVSGGTFDDVKDSFDEKTADVEVPPIDDSIINEVGENFKVGDSISVDALSSMDDPDLEHAIPFPIFDSFQTISFKGGHLKITINNQLGTTVTEITIGLHDIDDPNPLTFVLKENIADGEVVVLELSLGDEENYVTMGNEVELKITGTLEGDPEGDTPTLGIDVKPVNPTIHKAVVKPEDAYAIDEVVDLDPFYDEEMGVELVEFSGGFLHIDLIFPEDMENALTDKYALEVVLGEGDDAITFVEGQNPLEGVTIDLTAQPKVFFTAEEMDTYVADAVIQVTINLDVEQDHLYRVKMDEPIDFDGEREMDRPEDLNIKEVLFKEGSLLLIEIVYGDGEEEIDYTITIDIGGKLFYYDPLSDPIDLSSQGTLTFQEKRCMEINFTTAEEMDTYVAGAITVDVYLHEDAEVDEATLDDDKPFTVDGDIEEPLTGFPEEVSRIIFKGGVLEVILDDDGLGIGITGMGITLGGQELPRIDGTTQFSLAGLDLEAPDDGWGELKVEVFFEAEAWYYHVEKEITFGVELQDLDLERIYLKDMGETITQSISGLLGDDKQEVIREITFASGNLEFIIHDGDLDLDYDLEIFFGHDPLVPIYDEDNHYIFDLTGYKMVFPDPETGEELDLVVEFSLLSFSYKQGQENTVVIDGVLDQIDWVEMVVHFEDPSLLGVPAEFSPFTEEFDINIGLHELPDLFKQIKINRNQFHFDLIFFNETPFGFETKGYDEEIGEGDLVVSAIIDDEVVREERFKIRIPGGEERYSLSEGDPDFLDKFLDIFETFPERMQISGGVFTLLGTDESVTINKDLMVAMEGEYYLGLSLVLEKEEGIDTFEILLDPEPLDFEMDQMEMFQWIREATLFYELVNGMPFDGSISFVLGQFQGDYGNEDHVKDFYQNGEHFKLGITLPPAQVNEDGFVEEVSEMYRGEVSFTHEALDWFQKDNLHYGLQVTVPFEEEVKTISFSVSDYLQIKVWAAAQIRINPKDN